MNTIVAGMSEKKAVPPKENARIVAGTPEGESEIRAGLGKRFRNADEFIDHLEKHKTSMAYIQRLSPALIGTSSV
ncbi:MULTISPECIES: hypothetical protein [Methanothrix]|jgi:hypothetical protein|uniref:hypothetical protein n=1 Tax=Methanothrix TaxID=2222 RepID=UPI001B4C373D|nr:MULTISPECIES: hypothetical protein [Methanothrix]MBP7069139.1 hypothetical protein [Methanothrix sp.]MDD5256826.1 hypothetical protein [Methanothrix soehngenii]MDD5734779.1 hypothetical protein [Methanothrix soehngenii]